MTWLPDTEFDLLWQTRTNLLSKVWASPIHRQAMVEYFHYMCAKEEIEQINIEMQRLQTSIHDKQKHVQQTIIEISATDCKVLSCFPFFPWIDSTLSSFLFHFQVSSFLDILYNIPASPYLDLFHPIYFILYMTLLYLVHFQSLTHLDYDTNHMPVVCLTFIYLLILSIPCSLDLHRSLILLFPKV